MFMLRVVVYLKNLWTPLDKNMFKKNWNWGEFLQATHEVQGFGHLFKIEQFALTFLSRRSLKIKNNAKYYKFIVHV